MPAVIITFQTVSSAKLNCNWHTVGVTSPFSGWLVQRGSSRWSLKWAVQICFNERIKQQGAEYTQEKGRGTKAENELPFGTDVVNISGV